MIYPATKEIRDYFAENKIYATLEENDDSSCLRVNVSGDHGYYNVNFFSNDDTNDTAVRVMNYLRYPKEMEDTICEVVNHCNSLYRFVKFILMPDSRSVRIEYDFSESTSNIGKSALDLFYHILNIADDAYPLFMQAIWGGSSSDDTISNILADGNDEDNENGDDSDEFDGDFLFPDDDE